MESLVDTLRRDYRLSGVPSYQRKYCAAASSFGWECDRCVKFCREDVFQSGRKDKKPDFTRCSRCGFCVAVCPTKALTPMDTQARSFLMALARRDEISFGCEEDVAGWTVSLRCLASLSWEELACAALRNGAAVSLRACGDCAKQDCASLISETLDAVREFLGETLFSQRVRILKKGDGEAPRGKAISRRELLTFFKALPLDGARELLPEPEAGENGELLYRAVLRRLVRERCESTPKEARGRYVLPLPLVSDDCTGCGMCVRMCPKKALDLRVGPDGAKILTAEAWKCTGCAFCAKACRQKAVQGVGKMAVRHLGTVIINRIKTEARA